MAATDWKETIAPNEATHFDTLAGQLRELQREKAKLHGATMRGLHAKAHAGLRAELTTVTGLPDWAKVGIFATPVPTERGCASRTAPPALRAIAEATCVASR